ncbi:MAG: hypothetical protein AAFR88_04890 [Pseudomonadota bacterium]
MLALSLARTAHLGSSVQQVKGDRKANAAVPVLPSPRIPLLALPFGLG